MTNILETGRVGLLFLIRGVDETLRVNGRARLADEPRVLSHFAGAARAPESVRERSVLPTMGQMLNDQSGTTGRAETQEEMAARYLPDL